VAPLMEYASLHRKKPWNTLYMSTERSAPARDSERRRKVTTARLTEMKQRGEKIAMLTAYDYSLARILDEAGIDVLLVGDSASNVVHGHETTVPITLNQMIDHAAAVVRAVERALIVVDMPFGSYQGNSRIALESAVRIMKESGAHSVKMEGGEFVLESIKRILSAGIPVMGHLGLTPQSIYKFGTYVVRATKEDEAEQLVKDALLLQEAGCFALVLEKIPAELAARVSKLLTIPVIGIGAGEGVDGQVLVTHDMLGINNEFSPRFLRRYAQLYEVIKSASEQYIEDVKSGAFPNENERY
jgi:3-methyl-2-oxobutanoate hydroxymethyltransferase